MNSKQSLIKLYIDLRKERGSQFLFVPETISFLKLAQLMFFEAVRHTTSDALLLQYVLADLQQRGLLHKSVPVDYHQYTLKAHIFHDVYLRTSDNQQFCRGTSVDMMEAYAKACGEVFERTSLKYPPLYPDAHASVASLSAKHELYVDPASFAQPTQTQLRIFPSFQIDTHDVFAWTAVESIKTKKRILIPSQTIFYGTHARYTEKAIIQQSTHGAGASFTSDGAFRSGLLEIVHRHFFLKQWYAGAPFAQLDVHSIPATAAVGKLIADLREDGFTPHFLDCTKAAGLPSFICLLERNGGLYCGGSCGSTMLATLQRALSEAFATYLWVQQSKLRGEYAITPAVVDAVQCGFIDQTLKAHRRVHLYGNAYFVQQYVPQLLKQTYTTTFRADNDVHHEYDFEQYALQTFGEVYRHEIKNETLAAYGYHAVRVVIPQSHFFALHEKYSRPVLHDGTEPQNTFVNPFP